MKKKLIVGLLAAVLVASASVGLHAAMNNDASDGYIGIMPLHGMCGKCVSNNPLSNNGLGWPCGRPELGVVCSSGGATSFNSCC